MNFILFYTFWWWISRLVELDLRLRGGSELQMDRSRSSGGVVGSFAAFTRPANIIGSHWNHPWHSWSSLSSSTRKNILFSRFFMKFLLFPMDLILLTGWDFEAGGGSELQLDRSRTSEGVVGTFAAFTRSANIIGSHWNHL